MKWVAFFLLVILSSSLGTLALNQDQYVQQVLQKDIPISLRWFEGLSRASQLSQVEVYELYRLALPETRENNHQGISIKGSIERMILLLEATQYFAQVQNASIEYHERKENLLMLLQSAKDGLDRFDFGEDPQSLLEEWVSLGAGPFEAFTSEVVEVFLHLQKLLEGFAMAPDGEKREGDHSAFEKLRFESYLGSVESGNVAEECQVAFVWKTDQASSCRSDESPECDRNYARQCKRLQ